MEWIFWLALVAFFLIVEAFTPYLVSIWVAGGALVALVLSLFNIDLWVQIVAFIVVSIALIIVTRPFARRVLKVKENHTNADRNIGETATVTVSIDNTLGQGMVNLGGQIWTARSDDGEEISQGEMVTVQRIEGVKLIVAKK